MSVKMLPLLEYILHLVILNFLLVAERFLALLICFCLHSSEVVFLFWQKCMETKNTILARQKDMQHSLEKVKHLIRLIQAFNFNQATAAVVEPQGSEVRVQDGGQTAAVVPTEATATKEAHPGGGNADRSDQQGEQGAAENKQTAAAAVVVAAAVKGDVSPAPSSEGVPSLPAGAEVEVAGGNRPPESGPPAEGGAESRATPAADSSPALAAAAPSITTAATAAAAPAATTNGTPEPARSNGTPTPTPATNAANSENKTAAVSPPETAAEKKPEEEMTSDSGGSSNSKTSEPSQHSLPALVSSLDNKK